MSDEPQMFTDQSVYVVREYHSNHRDPIRMVFEDDADTLREVIDYCTRLEEGDDDGSDLPRRFHAADPGAGLRNGDWYLTKNHGVGVSHGFGDGETA